MTLSARNLTYFTAGMALMVSGVYPQDSDTTLLSMRHVVIYRNEDRYAGFPQIARHDDGRYWVIFGWNMSGSHLGDDPADRRGKLTMTADYVDGPWSITTDPPPLAINNSRVELSDGAVIMVMHHGWESLNSSQVDQASQRGLKLRQGADQTTFAAWKATIKRWDVPGAEPSSWIVEVPSPRKSMLGFGSTILLPGDIILKPVYGFNDSDEEMLGAWVMRSTDKGENWDFPVVAYDGVRPFGESSLIHLGGETVLALSRSCLWGCDQDEELKRGYLWSSRSDDGGSTWGNLQPTDMWGYPATLLRLGDGDLLATYGHRRPPYGIRACFSYDNGLSWDIDNEVVLREDGLTGSSPSGQRGAPHDLGYPHTMELDDGSLFTVYYITTSGITHIAGTHWSRPTRQP